MFSKLPPHYQTWLKQIISNTKFQPNKIIYQADYYSPEKLRNCIVAGTYQNKSAVLKAYTDPRPTHEPEAQINFLKQNQSQILTAPEVYDYKIINLHQGWLIMERLPQGGQFFKPPLTKEEKKQFFTLYQDYRQNFPTKPYRPLMLAEKLPAEQFQLHRIARWMELANNREESLPEKNLDPKTFIPLYTKTLEFIKKEFTGQPMVWCHGHFKPQELYKDPGSEKYYLTDFAHNKMYPPSYELAFIIWADWLLNGDYNLDFAQWQKPIQQWLDLFENLFPSSLMAASLCERIIGTILADVCATDKPNEEKQLKLKKLITLLEQLNP